MTSELGRKISVCILTYNHAGVVESTITSVLEQTIDDYEVLISDDCSTDGTWEEVQALAERHARVRVMQTPKNLGMAGNANFAVSQCDRSYVAILHHDDVYREDLLQRWAEVLDEHADVGFVFNCYSKHGTDFVYGEAIPAGRVDGKWLLDTMLMPQWGCPIRGTAMVRRSAWDSVGGMRLQFGMLADIDLWMRLSARWSVGYVDEPLIAVRHQRPTHYPSDYDMSAWSWPRMRLIYEIHGANRREMLDTSTFDGTLRWLGFRLRLNAETTKWLAYALVRRRPEMIRTADQGSTEYDLAPVIAIRWLLQRGQVLLG